MAEKLLESADAEGYEEDSEAAIHAGWADEIAPLIDPGATGLSVVGRFWPNHSRLVPGCQAVI